MPETHVMDFNGPEIERRVEDLCRILVDSVASGAAISFMSPLPYHDAEQFWLRDVKTEVAAGRRVVLGAERDGDLVGTVQLLTAMPPNQPHRCEVAKMIVHPRARRLGVGRCLINSALECARARGKTLVTLDTRTGDVAEPLYRSVGFATAGVIPDFAWDPDGKAKHATTYMFCPI